MSGLKKYLFFGTVLIVIYLVMQYNKPQPINWASTYLATDKIPFGTYILRQRITDIFPGTKIRETDSAIYNTLRSRPKGKSNLLIIAGETKFDKLDYREMIKYMEAGNSIFIASENMDGVLVDTLKMDIQNSLFPVRNKRYPINFVNPQLKRELDYYFDNDIDGQYFAKIDTAKTIILSEKESRSADFVQFKFGKGSLFILPNPKLLTNYSLLKDDGLDYASKALSYLPKAETLLWNEHFIHREEENKTELMVILKYDQLRWAYRIALFALVLFVLFEIKRRQRIIPIIAPLKNTSVEFTETVGRVYYQQRNNRDIADKKVLYLMEYLRNKYRVKTTTLDNEFKETLIKVTGAAAETIEELMIEIFHLQAGYTVTDQDLINLNKKIEQFYKQDR